MRLWIVLFLSLTTEKIDPAVFFSPRWIVWNVGQGQWITRIEKTRCLHMDAGGEFFPSKARLRQLCGDRKNLVFLSHWDWDHLGGLRHLKSTLQQACLSTPPGGKVASPQRRRWVAMLPNCEKLALRENPLELRWRVTEKSPNHASRVWVWRNQWIFPGDSPLSEEKKWVWQIPSPEKIRILVLGHHGSRTSTSEALLSRLPGVQVAIVSARMKRYGHPHPLVVRRLHQRKIPILRTEEWGSLIFETGFFRD